MGEDSKAPAMTIRIPAPRALAEAAARSPDARTAEVLRALHRAKGTLVGAEVPTSSPSTETLIRELQALREWLSTTSSATDALARRLGSCVTVLEQVVIVPSEKLAGFQRSQESVVRELRDAVHTLKRQADVLVTWRAWWTRRLATFSLVLALLLAGGIGQAWRAHALAKSTHEILAQILENQERAQAAKAGKRR
jgi:hypothetical protein